jgi:hypothetical protein
MMNKIKHLKGSVPLLMAAALCTSTAVLPAQSQATPAPQTQEAPPAQTQEAPPAQTQEAPPPQQGQQQEAQPQVKTYAGKIMKLQNGNYALITGQSAQGQAAGHFLDNQDEAKKYEGKQVTVTGTLEMASNTIHVTKIEAAA